MNDGREAGLREALARLTEAGVSATERAGLTSWLEMVLALPWVGTPRPRLDLAAVGAALEGAAPGQRDARERVLEGLAAGALRPDGRVPPVCLVGPPGVGKSHLAEA